MLYKQSLVIFLSLIFILASSCIGYISAEESIGQCFTSLANQISDKTNKAIDTAIAEGIASKLFCICKYPSERTEQEHKDAKDIFILRINVMNKLTEKLRKPGFSYDTAKGRAVVQFVQNVFELMDKYSTTYTISDSDAAGVITLALADRISDALFLYLRTDQGMSAAEKAHQERVKHIYILVLQKLYAKMPDKPEWTVRRLFIHTLFDPVASCNEGLVKISQAMQESTHKVAEVINDKINQVTQAEPITTKKTIQQVSTKIVPKNAPVKEETILQKTAHIVSDNVKYAAGKVESGAKYAADKVESGAKEAAHKLSEAAYTAKDSAQKTMASLHKKIAPPCYEEHDKYNTEHRTYEETSYTIPHNRRHIESEESVLVIAEKATSDAPQGYIIQKNIDVNVTLKRRKGPGLIKHWGDSLHDWWRHSYTNPSA